MGYSDEVSMAVTRNLGNDCALPASHVAPAAGSKTPHDRSAARVVHPGVCSAFHSVVAAAASARNAVPLVLTGLAVDETTALLRHFASRAVAGIACLLADELEIKPAWRCMVVHCERMHTLQFQLSKAGGAPQADVHATGLSLIAARLLADGVSIVVFHHAHNLPCAGALADFAGCFVQQGGCVVLTAELSDPRTVRLTRLLPALGFTWLGAVSGVPASGWPANVGGSCQAGGLNDAGRRPVSPDW
ncbi:hypothetical protein PQR70_36700 [Paraburkholderia madseniana]|uniref:hypothetical protein n=1 Tax=Paraburkholderia madseniana TaxID=2599607 RepID=UPI0038BA6A88